MFNKIVAVLVALSLSTAQAAGPQVKLTDYEEGIVIGVAHTAYSFGLLTLQETGPGEYHTALEPQVCWPFPVQWEEFYLLVEDNVKTQLASLSKQERKALGENVKYRAWQALGEEYGCYE